MIVAYGMDWRSAAACRNSDPDLFFLSRRPASPLSGS